MPRVAIRHRTEYRYAAPVSFGDHRLMTRPRDSHDLRLIEATLSFSPHATLRWKHDVFGNSVAVASFAEAADTLLIESRIVLDHFPREPADLAAMVEPYAETIPFAYAPEEVPDLGRMAERHFPDPDHAVDLWAKKFLSTEGPTRTADLLVAMTHAIKSDFTYEARDEEGTRPPTETLALSRGACRDFALLMMEACRSLGLAARFVSGYLYDAALAESDTPVVGGGATHAWVDVYVPGAGWVEFDPTNGLIGGRNLVRVAVARQPAQAIPISGSFIGRPDDFLGLSVEVTVEVGQGGATPPPAPEPAAVETA
ncbi:transglutaminase family protein [Elioraea tepida]|uniref:Transglutaminase family protein n=1 Tax=Elioraea tepida TaxID=2843330 RepID=A0A975YJC2_9PROT|nr:transglutaminase family protein [Elioraea tepida]QXM24504.1 transglutaminase family protein [Elioraea tepida]